MTNRNALRAAFDQDPQILADATAMGVAAVRLAHRFQERTGKALSVEDLLALLLAALRAPIALRQQARAEHKEALRATRGAKVVRLHFARPAPAPLPASPPAPACSPVAPGPKPPSFLAGLARVLGALGSR